MDGKKALTQSKKATKSFSEALEAIDKYADDFGDATKKLSKLAKYAKAFGAASVVLDITLGFLPQEDEKDRMLKEIISLVGELKNQITNLGNDVSAGFKKLYKDNEYRGAKTQINKSISDIKDFSLALESLTSLNSHLPEYINAKEQLLQDMSEARGTYIKLPYKDISSALQKIGQSCTDQGFLGINILKAATASSNADVEYLSKLGQKLISYATSAFICIKAHWDLFHEAEFEKKMQELEDEKVLEGDTKEKLEYIEKRMEEVKLKKEADIESARRRENKIFIKTINKIEKAVIDRIEDCKKYATIKEHVGDGVQSALDKVGIVQNAGVATEGLFNRLKRMWPNVGLIVLVNENVPMSCMENLNDKNLPTTKSEEKVSSNGKYKAFVLVVNLEGKVPEEFSWNKDPYGIKAHLSTYMNYRNDGNQNYYKDVNALAYYPYVFMHTTSLQRGLVTTPHFRKTYMVQGNNVYDLVVPI